MKQEGSVVPQFLFVLIFLSAIGIGLGSFLSTTMIYERNSEQRYAEKQALRAAASSVLDAFKEDQTPEADGRTDPIQTLNGSSVDGVKLTISDVSSALNANFVRKGVFQKTDLNSLFAQGKSADELQQYREDFDLSTEADHYNSFFEEETLAKQVGTYGWANVNVSDEFALSKLVAHITGSKDEGEAFRAKIQRMLISKEYVTREKIESFLGSDYAKFFPLICAEPAMNVNFVDPFVLKEVLSDPDFSLENASKKAKYLLEEREKDEVDENKLKSILGVDKSDRLLHYFGATTWFWKIVAEKDEKRCVLIVCRIPQKSTATAGEAQFEVVQTRFEP